MVRKRAAEPEPEGQREPDAATREDLEDRVAELSKDLSATLLRLKRERTKRNEALKEGIEVFQQFFDQNDEALLVFRPDTGEIADANPAAAALFGHSRDELVRKGLSLFVEPEELLNFNQIVTSTEVSDDARALSYTRSDGEKGIVSFRVKAIKLGERNVMFLSFRDITDEIRTKAEARFRQVQLMYSNRMVSLGLLLAGVTHEISSLNSLIMYNAQLVSEAWRDALPVLERHYRESGDFPLGGPLLSFSEMRATIPKLLPETIESAAKIKGIVESLVNVAREDRSAVPRSVDVNRILRSAVSMLSDHIQKHAERISLDLAADLPVVRGSTQKLEHLFVNLVLNALQALPNRTCGIRISTQHRKDRNAVEVRIRDEGVGMSRDLLTRLADPSFATRLDRGGGLGLNVVHMIVREHRGTIDFDSEVGKGTAATVTIPIGDAGASSGI